MGSELIRRVAGTCAAGLLPVTLGGFVAAGLPGGLGVLAGGAVSLGNLWLLVRGSHRALGLFAGRRFPPLWVLSLGLRHLALFGILALLLWSGSIHPVALLAGLSVLPPVLVTYALRAAGELS